MFTLRSVLLITTWAAAFWGALQIVRWPGDWGHAACGPWGCGPTLQALVACHLAWLVALTPIAVMLVRTRWATHSVRLWISVATTFIGGLLIIAVISYQWLVWLPAAEDCQKPYFWQRCGFVVIAMVEMPLGQLFLLGLIASLVCVRSKRRQLQ